MQACHQHSFKIITAESAQPRNCFIVTRPFSSWEGGGGLGAGSGYETAHKQESRLLSVVLSTFTRRIQGIVELA